MATLHGSAAVVGVQVSNNADTGDYAVSLNAGDVTMAEVFTALALPDQSTVNGQLVSAPAATQAAQVLHPGAALRSPSTQSLDQASSSGQFDERRGAEDMIDRAEIEIAVVAGLDAGKVTSCGTGVHRLVDLGLSSGWCLRLDATISTAGRNQPWHQIAPSIEAVSERALAVALAPPTNPEPGYSATVHRPPRVPNAGTASAIEVVGAPNAVPAAMALSWATLLAPIPIALMMAFFFRPIFALFAAMGPIMALGRWYESRRRFRRLTKERHAVVHAQIAEIADRIAEQQEAVAQLRWLHNPHVGELWRRTRHRSVRLWERRPGSQGYLVVTAGVGPDEIAAETTSDKFDDEVHAALRSPLQIRSVPHTVDLDANSGIGIHGDRLDTLAVVRSMVLQLATMHGPADLAIGILCSGEHATDWDWLKWLPHTDRALCGHRAKPIAARLGASNPRSASPGVQNNNRATSPDLAPVRLIVIDDASANVAALTRSAAESGQEVRILAIADMATGLPAACSSLIALHDGGAEIATPQLVGRRRYVQPVGISGATAIEWARCLAPLVDPEVLDLAATTDHNVSLAQLVELQSADQLAQRWRDHPADAPVAAAIGFCSDGPFRLDLTADGPHALIAGTTGSGKSELLRTMVLALAAQCPPDRLNFVLIDFKGGGAFDAVNTLPHVAGVITDLDETLVARALSSLRAELLRRETFFRDLGVSNYQDASRLATEPLARLVIVIDEFAALATDYAELMAAIIDLAARGRSLGMHLILATQRPSGVVDQKIRANTNLRVALRVQDTFDSQDVIGVPDAAHLDRKTPGRAIFSVGGDRPVHVQTAFSGAPDARTHRCTVRRHELFAAPAGADETAPGEQTELEVLVEAIRTASLGHWQAARPLWAAPLPETLDWIDLGARQLSTEAAGAEVTSVGVALGLADLPQRQTQTAWRWDPATGPLVVFGASAECSGKALLSVGAALASSQNPEQLHMYVVDGSAGATSQLGELPHTGAYISQVEHDRIDRTLRHFETNLQARRSNHGKTQEPRMVLLVDNLGSVLGNYDDVAAAAMLDRLSALARDGAALRLHLVIAARTVRDLPHRLAQQIPNRLVLALADPSGYLALGIKARDVPTLTPMRALDMGSGNTVQLVEPPDLSNWTDPPRSEGNRAAPIVGFPDVVEQGELGPASLAGNELSIPVGVEAGALSDAVLALHPGEHVLIVATNGMGRSALLHTIAQQLGPPDLGTDLIRVAPRGSAASPRDLPGDLVEETDRIDALATTTTRTLLLVDDANLVAPEMAAALERLVASGNQQVHVIAATDLANARSMLAWTSKIRSSGIGVMIGGTSADGELFKVRFGKLDELGTRPGRGHLIVRGRLQQVQFARPDAAS